MGEKTLIEAMAIPDLNERLAECRKLLREGSPAIWRPGFGGRTPLMAAGALNWPQGVALLIEAGAGPQERSDWGETPLEAAVSADAAEAVSELLRRGADPDMFSGGEEGGERGRFNAMELAAEKGSERSMAVLAKARARPRRAALAGVKAWRLLDLEEGKALLSLRCGADPNLVDEFGLTALHIVADAGDEGAALARELLSAGARVDAVDRDGMTPLGVALCCDCGAGRMVAELLAAGSDPSAPDRSGASPLRSEAAYPNPSGRAALKAWQESEALEEATPAGRCKK